MCNKKSLPPRTLEPDARYQHAAVEVVKLYGIVGVSEWHELPEHWRRFVVDNVSYICLIRPLVWRDRGNGLSWKQISIKYGVTVQNVRTICKKAYLCADK
jgi:hypothetical protein